MIMTIASCNVRPTQASTVSHLFGQALPSMRQGPCLRLPTRGKPPIELNPHLCRGTHSFIEIKETEL